MIFVKLLYNLGLLVSLSIISGYLTQHYQGKKHLPALQGLLFGLMAIIGMLNPFVMGPGLIFDGRSVVISLSGLYFGPLAAVISGLMAAILRASQGGTGVFTGILVILSSALIGSFFHVLKKEKDSSFASFHLYHFGLIVHIAMLLLMFTLPDGKGLAVLAKVGLPIILIYPLATILIGKVLTQQLTGITHLKQLSESEEKFRMLFDNTNDPIIWVDLETHLIINCNPFTYKLFERQEDELIGQSFLIFHPLETHETIKNIFLKHLENPGSHEDEIEVINKSGKKYWVEIATTRITINEKQIIQAIFRDISQRVLSEQALKHSESELRSYLENTPTAVLVADQDWNFLKVNPAACNISGYTQQELYAMTIKQLIPDNYLESAEEYFISLSSLGTIQGEIPFVTKSGQYRLCQIFAVILPDTRYLVNIVDITENKRYEVMLQEQAGKLQASNEELILFNTVAIGRELRMIELKKEVNELCEQMAQPQRYDLTFINEFKTSGENI